MKWLIKFKGVGPKTAAIVLQFSLDIPAFPVDTHVNRVTGRLGIRPEKMSVEQGTCLYGKFVAPRDVLSGTFEYYSVWAANLPCAQTRL